MRHVFFLPAGRRLCFRTVFFLLFILRASLQQDHCGDKMYVVLTSSRMKLHNPLPPRDGPMVAK